MHTTLTPMTPRSRKGTNFLNSSLNEHLLIWKLGHKMLIRGNNKNQMSAHFAMTTAQELIDEGLFYNYFFVEHPAYKQ